VSCGRFEFGAAGQDGLELLLVVVVHAVGVPGGPASHLADLGRPRWGRTDGPRAAEAPDIGADDGVGAGKAALTEFSVELGTPGVALVPPLVQADIRCS
jgi:hypothetical protein